MSTEIVWLSIAAGLMMGLAGACLFVFAVKRGYFHDFENAKYQVFWSDLEPLTAEHSRLRTAGDAPAPSSSHAVVEGVAGASLTAEHSRLRTAGETPAPSSSDEAIAEAAIAPRAGALGRVPGEENHERRSKH